MPNKPFEIESGVPLPLRSRSGARLGPITAAIRALAAAKVDDSVFIPDIRPAKLGPYFRRAVAAKGWYVSRSVEGGTRVWKIAEPKPHLQADA